MADAEQAGSPAAVNMLLVDNLDSYTFNLYQMLAEQNGGCPPVVLTNDASWEEVAAVIATRAIDCVVISPGPGSPDCPADFGVCRDIIDKCSLPILGVCLGHQGIGHCHGGKVVRAPSPVHGRLWPVTVMDEPPRPPEAAALDGLPALFAGVPSPFKVVRYHSLALDRESLPAMLQPLAETADSERVLMGLRHATKPQWGIQFHPESICTEHGATLLGNFLAISRAWRARQPTLPAAATPAAGSATSPHVGSVLRPLPVAGLPAGVVAGSSLVLLADRFEFPAGATAAEYPAAVFARCFGAAEPAFWLDSARPFVGSTGFSFMGGGDGPRAELAEYAVETRTLELTSGPAAGTAARRAVTLPAGGSGLFGWIRARLQASGRPRPQWVAGGEGGGRAAELPFEFHGGYVGYLGYELRHECGHEGRRAAEAAAAAAAAAGPAAGAAEGAGGEGAAAAAREGVPTAALLFSDRYVAFDLGARQVFVLSLADPSDCADVQAAEEWIGRTRAAALRPAEQARAAAAGPVDGRGEPPLGMGWVDVELARGRDQYMADIARCHELITAGETYEVCLTTRVEAAGIAPPTLPLYTELRRRNPAPYGALLSFGAVAVLSSSPECFLKVSAAGEVTARSCLSLLLVCESSAAG